MIIKKIFLSLSIIFLSFSVSLTSFLHPLMCILVTPNLLTVGVLLWSDCYFLSLIVSSRPAFAILQAQKSHSIAQRWPWPSSCSEAARGGRRQWVARSTRCWFLQPYQSNLRHSMRLLHRWVVPKDVGGATIRVSVGWRFGKQHSTARHDTAHHSCKITSASASANNNGRTAYARSAPCENNSFWFYYYYYKTRSSGANGGDCVDCCLPFYAVQAYKKPTSMPAPKYIGLLMDWTEALINDDST